MRDFAESSGDRLRDNVEDEEENGIPGPDYAQMLEELFGSLCGEDNSDSTLCIWYVVLRVNSRNYIFRERLCSKGLV